MSQHQITKKHALLDNKGHLTEAGYSKHLLLDYDRNSIKANKLRIKEWDYYLVACDDFAVALTIADNSYMGLDSISLLDFNVPWEHTNSPMAAFTMGKKKLPPTSSLGDVLSRGKNYSIEFKNNGSFRTLDFSMDNFQDGRAIDGQIRLDCPPMDSMVIATPFAEKKTAFYYNQKVNCMPASGIVNFDGKEYVFPEGKSFGVLDWRRGVWTYKNTWYWGSASGQIGGVPFGWNIGYGFGDTSAATENMLFYNNKAHKLSKVNFNIPTENGKEDYMKPWTFDSDDGRFEMEFFPIIDRASCTDVKLICSDQHQVFGKFSGRAVLDDGTVIGVKDFLGFAEKVFNKW